MSDEEEDRVEVDAEGADEPTGAEAEAAGQFTHMDEQHEIFTGQPEMRVIADDGLPAPVVDDVVLDAHAPPYIPETNQVCAALDHVFVIRAVNDGDVLASWPADKVRRVPNGEYRASLTDCEMGEKLTKEVGPQITEPARGAAIRDVLGRHCRDWGYALDGETLDIQVEPLRPRCEYYLLQLRPPSKSMEYVLKQGELTRHCMLRRSVAGAFMGLGNEAMKACSARMPFDLETDEKIVYFERTLADKGRHRTYHPMFVDKTKDGEDPHAAFKKLSEELLGKEGKLP